MQRTQINLRIDISELGRWQAEAAERCLSLSAWIREKCNAENGNNSGLRRHEAVHTVEGGVAAVGGSMEPAKKSKAGTCPHGVEKEWRCTLCGGIVP